MPCRCSSQLRYSPNELVILGKVNARPLTVFRRLEPELNRTLADEQRIRQKVATVDGATVDRQQLYLASFVPRPDVAGRGTAVGLDADHDDAAFTVEAAPLALHPEELVGDLEYQIRAPVLGYRLEDRDPRLHRLESDRCFGNVPFCVRILHEHMFPYKADRFACRRAWYARFRVRRLRSRMPMQCLGNGPSAR